MKWLKFLLSICVIGVLIYILDHPLEASKSTLPPIGRFLNPFTGFWKNSRLQDVSKLHIQSSHLDADASIEWDQRMVPHISASNEHDAFYLQGYTIASMRLWQMDMLARSAVGELAEVLGKGLVSRDLQQRRIGMLFAAENAVEGWKKDTVHFKLLQAYCQGINDWITQLRPADYPVEYKIMNFKPALWSPLKTAAVVKYMAQSLCSREFDIEATNTRSFLGDSLYDFLYPSFFEKQSPVIPSTPTSWDYIKQSIIDSSGDVFKSQQGLYHRTTPMAQAGLGSNNWAVSGTKTTTGRPILCNDPHLRLTLPSIWFENHLTSSEFNAYGVSVPGIAGILIGFNDSIAWGETNVGHDVADWYTIQWTDATKSSYLIDGQPKPIQFRYENIKIKNSPDLLDTIKYTDWGPVITDTSHPYGDLAYHWIAHHTPHDFEMKVFLNLMKSKNYLDYYNALNGYTNPAQNFVFADHSGNIAITVNGLLPLKKKSQGNFIQDGSLSANAWSGYIPYKHLPRVVNPERGFVSSANQHSTDANYPYPYTGDFDNFRGRYLNQQLSTVEKLSSTDMKSLQTSNISLKAKDNLPLMIEATDQHLLNADQLSILNALKDWKYQYDANEKGAIYFHIWFRNVYKNLFDELYTHIDSNELQYPKQFILNELLTKYRQHGIWDMRSTPKKESYQEIIYLSFIQACDSIRRIPPDIQSWAGFNKTRIQHMANLPGFSKESIQIGGTNDVLNAVANGSGPSWRMIVELNDQIKASVIYPGGQSGHPASAFYDNMIDDWSRGIYQNAQFKRTPETSLFTQHFNRIR